VQDSDLPYRRFGSKCDFAIQSSYVCSHQKQTERSLNQLRGAAASRLSVGAEIMNNPESNGLEARKNVRREMRGGEVTTAARCRGRDTALAGAALYGKAARLGAERLKRYRGALCRFPAPSG
jgi:hypothetical protein